MFLVWLLLCCSCLGDVSNDTITQGVATTTMTPVATTTPPTITPVATTTPPTITPLATTTGAGCQTTAGNLCVFSFTYRGVTYNNCASVDNNGVSWCYDSRGSKKWGDCDPTTCEGRGVATTTMTPVATTTPPTITPVATTTPPTITPLATTTGAGCQTTAGNLCVFPFTYRGVTYNNCASVDNNGVSWCYDSRGSKKWGDCDPTTCEGRAVATTTMTPVATTTPPTITPVATTTPHNYAGSNYHPSHNDAVSNDHPSHNDAVSNDHPSQGSNDHPSNNYAGSNDHPSQGTNTPSATTTSPQDSGEDSSSKSSSTENFYVCDDGCKIRDSYFKDGICDCSKCEDERDFTCETCGGCPTKCKDFVNCSSSKPSNPPPVVSTNPPLVVPCVADEDCEPWSSASRT
eukprot:g1892.t1